MTSFTANGGLKKEYVEVLERRMAFASSGSGPPIIFLHGNPTSSYIWRNVIPHVQHLGRCVAPDLIGMGDSDKLPRWNSGHRDIQYSYQMHAAHLDRFMDEICGSQRVILVLHDWGSAFGFDWARRHEHQVRGIAYMESFVLGRRFKDMSLRARLLFLAVRRSEWLGMKMILQRNIFVERGIPAFVIRELSQAEMNEYRRPFEGDADHRRPILAFQRELPIDGEPANIQNIFDRFSRWFQESSVPKLFINAEPGYQIAGPRREYCRTLKNQTEVTVAGLHYLQEDSPEEIGRAISGWIESLST